MADEKQTGRGSIADAFEEAANAMVGPVSGKGPTPAPVPADDPKVDDDVVDPVKSSEPPSDKLEAPDTPAGDEPLSARFPDDVQPGSPEQGPSDDLGSTPSEVAQIGHDGTASDPPEGGVDVPGLGHLDEGDLMPAEVQDPTFPDPNGEPFDDPGFSLEPPSDFGASDEVPSDTIDGFDGGSMDEGF